MAEYEIPEEKRPGLEQKLEEWIRLDAVRHLEVVRSLGNRQTSKISGSEIDHDEMVELGSGEAILDRVIEHVGSMGGAMKLRLRFQGYDKPGGPSDEHISFRMRRVKEPSTKSQGSNAATEQLATSLATAFDAQATRMENRDARFTDLMSDFMVRSDEASERRLGEHATFQMEIMRLRDELSRAQMQLAFSENQPGVPPEVWVEVAKAAIPVVGDLVGTAKVAIQAWGQSHQAPELNAPIPQTEPIPSAAEAVPGEQAPQV